MDCGLPGFFVHRIFQARILGQVAISYSRESLGPSNQTHVSCVGVQILYCCTAWEAQSCVYYEPNSSVKPNFSLSLKWSRHSSRGGIFKTMFLLVSKSSCVFS